MIDKTELELITQGRYEEASEYINKNYRPHTPAFKIFSKLTWVALGAMYISACARNYTPKESPSIIEKNILGTSEPELFYNTPQGKAFIQIDGKNLESYLLETDSKTQ